MKEVDVSIIVVSFNTSKLTVSCLQSIKQYTKDINYEIILVDNASKDDTIKKIKNLSLKTLKIIENSENVGFAEANNQAIKIAKGKYLLLLNSDTYLTEDSISKMVSVCSSNNEIGITSCQLRNLDNSIQPSGGYFPTLTRLFYWFFFIDDIPLINKLINSYHPKTEFFKKSHEQDWITGAFFMVKKEVTKEVGLFDPEYFMYVEEMDYCYRAKNKNWKIWFDTSVSIVHLGQGSGNNDYAYKQEMKNIRLFYKKHFPHLSLVVFALVKLGTLFRTIVFAILGKPTLSKLYANIFQQTKYPI